MHLTSWEEENEKGVFTSVDSDRFKWTVQLMNWDEWHWCIHVVKMFFLALCLRLAHTACGTSFLANNLWKQVIDKVVLEHRFSKCKTHHNCKIYVWTNGEHCCASMQCGRQWQEGDDLLVCIHIFACALCKPLLRVECDPNSNSTKSKHVQVALFSFLLSFYWTKMPCREMKTLMLCSSVWNFTIFSLCCQQIELVIFTCTPCLPSDAVRFLDAFHPFPCCSCSGWHHNLVQKHMLE